MNLKLIDKFNKNLLNLARLKLKFIDLVEIGEIKLHEST
jgi:hypothetical protein